MPPEPGGENIEELVGLDEFSTDIILS